jgi:hypothetical protein
VLAKVEMLAEEKMLAKGEGCDRPVLDGVSDGDHRALIYHLHVLAYTFAAKQEVLHLQVDAIEFS